MCFCFSLCWHVLFVFVGASVSSYMRCHPPLIVIPISLGGKQNIVHISYIPIPWPQICVFPNIQQFLRVILRVCIYMCIYIFEYTYTYVYIYTYVYMCMCVCSIMFSFIFHKYPTISTFTPYVSHIIS